MEEFLSKVNSSIRRAVKLAFLSDIVVDSSCSYVKSEYYQSVNNAVKHMVQIRLSFREPVSHKYVLCFISRLCVCVLLLVYFFLSFGFCNVCTYKYI